MRGMRGMKMIDHDDDDDDVRAEAIVSVVAPGRCMPHCRYHHLLHEEEMPPMPDRALVDLVDQKKGLLL